MIAQQAQGPWSTAGILFLRNKMRKEKNEREKGEGVNFQENVLALEVGRWAAEDDT